jgi:hypothetical protein
VNWLSSRGVGWRNGDRVRAPSGATGTVTAVRRDYLIVTWDDLARRRVRGLPARTKLGLENSLRKMP